MHISSGDTVKGEQKLKTYADLKTELHASLGCSLINIYKQTNKIGGGIGEERTWNLGSS